MDTHIVACYNDVGVISYACDNHWEYAKQVCYGHPVLMDTNTYNAFPKPLPGSTNFVVTTIEDFVSVGALLIKKPKEIFHWLGEKESISQIFIIGGVALYSRAINIVSRMYITRISDIVLGGEVFPEFDEDAWFPISQVVNQEYSHFLLAKK